MNAWRWPGWMPDFAGSPPIFTSISTGRGFVAVWFSFSASSCRSTHWTQSKCSATFFALFVCRCPMKCHVRGRSRSASRLDKASWSRFSPISAIPAPTASRIFSAGTVLVTAINLIDPGERPLRTAAVSILSRIRRQFSRTSVILVFTLAAVRQLPS